MKNKLAYILSGVILILVSGIFIYGLTEDRSQDRDYRNLFYRHYRIIPPEVPAKLDFAGENMPLNLYYVRESLERELLANTYMHSSTIMMFKRANRWFPIIEPILKKNKIPDDFKYLVLAESNLVNVVSPAGAEGFWQFIKTTGIRYGLEITEEVDERYNVEKATQAACDYFRDAYEQYKSWTLVAASYNRGIDGVQKAIDKQKVSNYYDLFLVDETARYVYRIAAIKQVYLHPVQFGFYLRDSDLYPVIPTTTVTVDSGITDLVEFASKMKINYRILRELNPWIRRYSLPNKNKKSYVIRLPKEGAMKYELLMKSMTHSETFFHDTLKINQVN